MNVILAPKCIRPNEWGLFKTDEWRDKYKAELSKYRFLTDGQRTGIRNGFLTCERAGLPRLNGAEEYEEILRAQEIMDKLTT